MRNQTTVTRPLCHWVTVIDASGRSRVEARWEATATTTPATTRSSSEAA
jgi:hypothetical protein